MPSEISIILIYIWFTFEGMNDIQVLKTVNRHIVSIKKRSIKI